MNTREARDEAWLAALRAGLDRRAEALGAGTEARLAAARRRALAGLRHPRVAPRLSPWLALAATAALAAAALLAERRALPPPVSDETFVLLGDAAGRELLEAAELYSLLEEPDDGEPPRS